MLSYERTLFAGLSFCLSQKLTLRDASQLRDMIKNAGGSVVPGAKDPTTIIVVDGFDLVRPHWALQICTPLPTRLEHARLTQKRFHFVLTP